MILVAGFVSDLHTQSITIPQSISVKTLLVIGENDNIIPRGTIYYRCIALSAAADLYIIAYTNSLSVS